MNKPHSASRAGRRVGFVALALIVLVVASLLARPALERWTVKRIEAALDAMLVPEVRIAGPLVWQLWPHPGVTLAGLAMTDGARPLVGIERIEVEFDPGAWLARQLVIDRVMFHRPELLLGPDGVRWLSVDAWLVAEDRAAGGAAPVVRQFVVREGRVESSGSAAVRVSDLSIKIDMPAAQMQPGWVVAGADLEATVQGVSLAGRLSQHAAFELGPSGVRAHGLNLSFTGTADRFEALDLSVVISDLFTAPEAQAHGLELAMRAEGAGSSLHLDSTLVELALTGDMLVATDLRGEAVFDDGALRASGDFRLRQLQAVAVDDIRAEAAIAMSLDGLIDASGDFDGRVDYSVDTGTEDHVRAEGRLTLRLPHPSERGSAIRAELDTRIDWSPRSARAHGALAGRLDGSELTGSWRFDRRDQRPLRIDAGIDRLDLDAYLGETGSDGAPDLAPWRAWPLSAELVIGELRWRGMLTTGTRLSINPD